MSRHRRSKPDMKISGLLLDTVNELEHATNDLQEISDQLRAITKRKEADARRRELGGT